MTLGRPWSVADAEDERLAREDRAEIQDELDREEGNRESDLLDMARERRELEATETALGAEIVEWVERLNAKVTP